MFTRVIQTSKLDCSNSNGFGHCGSDKLMKYRHSGARAIDRCDSAMFKCKNKHDELIVPICNSTVVHGNIHPIYFITGARCLVP